MTGCKTSLGSGFLTSTLASQSIPAIRCRELEADRYGIDYLYSSNWKTTTIDQMLDSITKQDTRSLQKLAPVCLVSFATHTSPIIGLN